MADLFVSYSRVDKARVAPLVAALESQGWSVWWDPEIVPGQEFDRLITQELEKARAVVAVWTPASVASRWVRGEARVAADRGVLAPVRFEGAELPIDLRAIHTTDLDAWGDDAGGPAFAELSRALRSLLGEAGHAAGGKAAKSVRSHSICVLPFANLSGDPEQEYFSDGISEDITTDLSKVSALEVTARNTAFQFKGKSLDMAQLAEQLRVSHVLEGSVRKAGGRVRITAQLIDGATGNHVWAERWDRTLDDIFALQDEISEAIVGALKLKLLPEEKQAIEQRGTDNAEAYNLYLMARSHSLTGNSGDPRQQEAIERLTRRAVDLDPGYAHAWALLASAQFSLHRDHGRAGDGGQAALDRAVALNPDLAEARSLKALRLCHAGRQEEAEAEIAAALRLDPESYEVNSRAGSISYYTGRWNDAARHFEKAALIETNFKAPFLLISCYTALGDAENTRRAARIALERAEKAVAQDRSNGSAMDVGVTALAALGESERARDWIDRALLIDPDNLLMRYNFACALASWLRDADAALDMLGQALGPDPGWLARDLAADPDFAGLRDDPRFQAIFAHVQLAAAESGARG